MKIRMNLTSKILLIPGGILIMSFIVIGIIVSLTIIAQSNTIMNNELRNLIISEKKQLITSLSLISASQLPADALLELRNNDVFLAEETIKQVRNLGLDQTLFTDLDGNVIYPKNYSFSKEVSVILADSKKEAGSVNMHYLNGKLMGYVPIINIDIPIGFIIFAVNIPNALSNITQEVLSQDKDADYSKTTSISLFMQKSHDATQTLMDTFLTKTMLTIGCTLFASLVLIMIILGILEIRIIRSLKAATNAADQIVAGDMTIELTPQSTDEIADMLISMNAMIDKLSEFLSTAKVMVEQTVSGSSDMSSIAQDITRGANEQAITTKKTTSAMNQMMSSLEQNTTNAYDTKIIAEKASIDAQKGAEVMEEAVRAIKKIVERVSIIKDIANKTNILAINATIEAASADDHGKRFAVVAREINKLADNSKIAAAEIKELSFFSVDIAERAGKQFHNLVPDITQTSQLMGGIYTASTEMYQITGQVKQSVLKLNDVINNNVSATNKMLETINYLSSHAQQLANIISTFKIRNKSSIK